MKTTLLMLALGVLAWPAASQPFSIDWFEVAGGGGTSASGQYSLSGTIGQHDAGVTMINGQYSITGGFWVLPTVFQTSGAPRLTIFPAGPGSVMISWTPAAPGYVLQETPGLAPSTWANSSSGATNPIVVPATVSAKFYRLVKP